MQRAKRAVDALQLADETDLSTGQLNVRSHRNDDTNDARIKSRGAPKSRGASTPGKASAARDRSNGSGDATSSISSLRQLPQRYLGTVFEAAGGTSAARCADLSAATPMPIKGSGNAAAALVGGGLFSTRTSLAGASSPAVQALGGLRRVRSTSSTAGGTSGAAYSHKEAGPDDTCTPGTSYVADAAIALVRASEALRSNWKSLESPKRSDSEASEGEQLERREYVGRKIGSRKAKRPASAVLGVRQRVAAAAPMTLATPLSSGGGGANEGPAHKRQQRLRSPQVSLAGAGRGWEECEALGSSGGVLRQVHNTSEGGAKWRARRDDVPMVRSGSRTAADGIAFGGNAVGTLGARGQRGGCIHSSSSSSSSDDDQRLPRDRGIVETGKGRRGGVSSGGASGGLDAVAARRRSGSVGGGLMAGGWFELASSNPIAARGAGRSTGGGGRSTGGGQGILHSYSYNISSSSSSTSTSHDGDREDAVERMDAVDALDGKRSSASPRGVRASNGGGLTAVTSVASSTALAPHESAGMSKLRGQIERARQSLLRLQLSSGGGGPPLPQDAVGVRRSGPVGLGASQGGIGPNMGAGPGRGDSGSDDRNHDVVRGSPDDDISMLLSALLEGQLSSAQEGYSVAAMATAAATSGGGSKVRFAAAYPYGAAAAARGDEDDDEPWRIPARPLPPGKLVRLLRALQQLHLRNPQLLRSRRHGRRLWRLLQGVSTGDGEAEMLLDTVTGGRGAVGAAPMQRRAINDRSSGGGSAVAALAAAMFGVGGGPAKSSDGCTSSTDVRFRAVATAQAPAGQRPLRTDRGTPLEVKPSASRSLAQWQEASLLAQVWAARR
ncbi:hypothetical protein Vafri_4976 [Volvox africanus]|uniref:Uncharacterized protein n=1 Tax=Volvox africanus TaxID=51714 RepID=A0A8J4AW95_9CHLO|nr:hypothetical protein Vafri_4976 [Volvox africanus]